MKNDLSLIENLLERFFEGKTSNEEEKMLYDFFNQDPIPEHLIGYKPIFSYFEKGLEEKNLMEHTVNPQKRIKLWSKQWLLWGGMVASVLAVLWLYSSSFAESDPIDPFEGSYIVQNGVRNANLEEIRPVLEATLKNALEREREMKLLVMSLAEKEEKNKYFEQRIFSRHEQLFEHITDEEVRKEIQEIIQFNH